MNAADLFVGMVSVVLGISGLVAACDRGETKARLARIRWIESLVGRSAARAIYGVVGALLIGLGVAIALGKT